MKEEPLSGGRVTPHVVKLDNTVRRPLGTHSEFVHPLLLYLEKRQFNGAPRFLGIDDQGREILSYIEGNVPKDLGYFTDAQLIKASQLIKTFHDVTTDSGLVKGEEVVCHNDLSPCNTVFQNDEPIAFIDFDAAAPGTRLHDLSYAIWFWCDLGNSEIEAKEQSRRIRLMQETYGYPDTQTLLLEIMKRQEIAIQEFRSKSEEHWQGAIRWAMACLTWVQDNLKELIRGLK